MIKIYVMDTNVLIQSPNALFSFEDNLVVLPMVVLEELDHLKKADGETGANARKCIRLVKGTTGVKAEDTADIAGNAEDDVVPFDED